MTKASPSRVAARRAPKFDPEAFKADILAAVGAGIHAPNVPAAVPQAKIEHDEALALHAEAMRTLSHLIALHETIKAKGMELEFSFGMNEGKLAIAVCRIKKLCAGA